jgi:predicted nucleic acid-binding protein
VRNLLSAIAITTYRDSRPFCGRGVRRAELLGRPIDVMDAFLAATAEVNHLILVTRNVSDFAVLKKIVNPWSETPS